MIPESESCTKSIAWVLVFCVISLMSACADEEPAEQVAAEAPAGDQPLPVREWYPRQKFSAPQPQMIQPPVSSSTQAAQQQAWSSGYQAYSAPQVIIVQPSPQWYGSGTAGQIPGQQMATPQQFVSPYYYQEPQRPWGGVPQDSHSAQQTYTQPPAGGQQINPWSAWQTPGGMAYPGWGVPYGGYPGTVPPGYTW